MTGTRPHHIRCNGVEIDTALGMVRRDGDELYLRSKAHQLLVCLIDHREGPVSKEQLLSTVWEGVAVSDTAIFSCIQEIRKALGDDAREPVFIRTMSKKGYWFVAPVEDVAAMPQPVSTISAAMPAPPARRTHRKWIYAAASLCLLTGIVLVARVWRPAAEEHYGEVAWWKLDEGKGTVVRDSVQGIPGTLTAGASWSEGISGGGLKLDGGTGLVHGVDPDKLPRGAAARTMLAWIRTSDTNSDSTLIFRYGEPAGLPVHDAFHLQLYGNGRAAFWNGIRDPMTGPRVDDGLWHQVAGAFEGAQNRRVRLYVDGKEYANEILQPEGLRPGGRSEWAIGGLPWGGTRFRGSIDDIRVFDRPLRPAEIRTLYICGAGKMDMGEYLFAPVLGNEAAVEAGLAGESSSRVRNTGVDHSGITFIKRPADCPTQSLRASDIGQDLRIAMDLRLGGSLELMAEAGPFFRSRNAAPGDGIVGGTSAGYWVQLQSNGAVRVRRLHPDAVVAFSKAIPSFDVQIFHRLEVEAKGEFVTAWLDGKPLVFDQTGKSVGQVHIPPAWETATPKGANRGSAGVAFGCYLNRGKLTGQEARNITVEQVASSRQ